MWIVKGNSFVIDSAKAGKILRYCQRLLLRLIHFAKNTGPENCRRTVSRLRPHSLGTKTNKSTKTSCQHWKQTLVVGATKATIPDLKYDRQVSILNLRLYLQGVTSDWELGKKIWFYQGSWIFAYHSSTRSDVAQHFHFSKNYFADCNINSMIFAWDMRFWNLKRPIHLSGVLLFSQAISYKYIYFPFEILWFRFLHPFKIILRFKEYNTN